MYTPIWWHDKRRLSLINGTKRSFILFWLNRNFKSPTDKVQYYGEQLQTRCNQAKVWACKLLDHYYFLNKILRFTAVKYHCGKTCSYPKLTLINIEDITTVDFQCNTILYVVTWCITSFGVIYQTLILHMLFN